MSDSDALVVLFADISGSTRLYEEFGDHAARAAVAECVSLMSDVVERFGGRVLKTIGDEIMCVLPDPSKAVMASNDLQMAVRAAGEQGRFETGPLHVKIGMHVGPGVEMPNDVRGEASIIAQQVTKLAKADQILASAEIRDSLPPSLRFGSREFDRVIAEGRAGELEVVEMIWEVSDMTQIADTRPQRRPDACSRLELRYRDRCLTMGPESDRVAMGRVADNDVVVPTDLTSRNHAELCYRHGGFQLTDNSANGTVIETEDGRMTRLKRETHVLRGKGRICLGGTPADNPAGVIEYDCE